VPQLAPKRFLISRLAPALLAVAVLSLAGCGRRGALEAPPGASGASASSPAAASRLSPGLTGGSSRQNLADRDPLSPPARRGDAVEDGPPIPAPDRPFILDAIL
jgi:predicted small lipoprotein YifL